MRLAGQDTPKDLEIPDEATRVLRARLILEEALETVDALGVSVALGDADLHYDALRLTVEREADLEGVVDGCADISVVTIGTLVAFGVDDEPVLEEVDRANLRKFGPGSYARQDGKWIKPPDWEPPDIMGAVGLGGRGAASATRVSGDSPAEQGAEA